MGYDFVLPDTSTRNKMMGIASNFAPDINPYYAQIQQAGDEALKRAFGAADQRIGQQFSPMFRLAQARLGANPLLADSGYANRLNRRLSSEAFGALSGAYGDAASQQAQMQQSALERLIQTRLGGQQNILQSILGTAQKKKGAGGAIGGALGAGIGTLIAPGMGTMVGGSMGSSLGGGW